MVNGKTVSIGLDLSINSTGVCCMDGDRECEYFIIVPKLSKKMKMMNEEKGTRISHIEYSKIKDNDSHNIRCIAKKICDIIADMREKGREVESITMEDVAMRAQGRSIITLTLLNGYVRCMLDGLGMRYKTVNPTQWKKQMLGNGAADKELIIYNWSKMDRESYEEATEMGLKCDDIADAYFLACYGE